MKVFTEIEKQLIGILRDIWDDKDFILGVITDLETDEERQTVIDYIKENRDTASDSITDDIILLSLFIDQTRQPENDGHHQDKI